jgi:hypothetical protein
MMNITLHAELKNKRIQIPKSVQQENKPMSKFINMYA